MSHRSSFGVDKGLRIGFSFLYYYILQKIYLLWAKESKRSQQDDIEITAN
ncbi:hypothetical protein [Nostoc sp. NMS8]|nr:hypothetical protein [Nostoc sp. NMS8]MBN3957670.1 hypothetical protein [Nostoc sp. NMS8]